MTETRSSNRLRELPSPLHSTPPVPLDFTLKVVSRCNLDCSYCYVYHKADSTWRTRPRIMPDEVFRAALERIGEHCAKSGQRLVHLTFHGGEPLLAGVRRSARWCDMVRAELSFIEDVRISMQTNGTLITPAWTKMFLDQGVGVGVSVDGAPQTHDIFRVDRRGRGSSAAVGRGLDLLTAAGVPFGILCVIPLGTDPMAAHRYFTDAGVRWVDYLLPGYTHDDIGPVRQRFGPTPCADYLLPVLDEWWANEPTTLRIRLFWEMTRLVLGGKSRIDALGNAPFRYVFVETDGEIQGLDLLRLCGNGVPGSPLNVCANSFGELADAGEMHRLAIFDGLPVPGGCLGCPERHTCAGGYLPHRYGAGNGFDNRSVWCADLLALFRRVRELTGVGLQETVLRRRLLGQVAREKAAAGAMAEARAGVCGEARSA